MIPASQRPDGTWRKARRVKDGYVPQEEVPLYESKGKLFAQGKPTGPVGGGGGGGGGSSSGGYMPPARVPYHQQPTPGLVIIKPSRPAKPKKEPQQQQQQKGKNTNSTASTSTTASLATQMERLSLSPEEEKDPEKLLKHLKKLRKKLREIDNIEQKIKSGEIKTPDKDQLDKVARKKLIRIEVDRLEKHPLLIQAEAQRQSAVPVVVVAAVGESSSPT